MKENWKRYVGPRALAFIDGAHDAGGAYGIDVLAQEIQRLAEELEARDASPDVVTKALERWLEDHPGAAAQNPMLLKIPAVGRVIRIVPEG